MNGIIIIFCVLSSICALWGLGGLLAPKEAIPFALPKLQTPGNAFWFPMRFAAIFAIAAAGMTYGADNDGIAFWAWFIGGILFWKTLRRREILVHGFPLY